MRRSRRGADVDFAARALSCGDTLLRVVLCSSRAGAVQAVTLSILSCTCKPFRDAARDAWRGLCQERWPSSAAFGDAAPPDTWRAYALMRSADDAAALDDDDDDADDVFAARVPRWHAACLQPLLACDANATLPALLLLDVYVSGEAVFSAALGAPAANAQQTTSRSTLTGCSCLTTATLRRSLRTRTARCTLST